MGGGGDEPDKYTYSLLAFEENNFKDIGSGGLTWASTSPSYIHTSSVNPKYGKYSLELNTNSSSNEARCLTTTSNTLKSIFTNPFTIDWWEYRLSTYPWFPRTSSGYCAYTSVEINYGNNINTNSFGIENCNTEIIAVLAADNKDKILLQADLLTAFSGWDQIICTIDYDVYNHIAITYDGSNFRTFYNGQLTNTLTQTNLLTDLNTINLGLNFVAPGRNDQWCYLFHGYIDMFRVSNICRWTTDFDCNKIKYFV